MSHLKVLLSIFLVTCLSAHPLQASELGTPYQILQSQQHPTTYDSTDTHITIDLEKPKEMPITTAELPPSIDEDHLYQVTCAVDYQSRTIRELPHPIKTMIIEYVGDKEPSAKKQSCDNKYRTCLCCSFLGCLFLSLLAGLCTLGGVNLNTGAQTEGIG
jgi:hypothetical protein